MKRKIFLTKRLIIRALKIIDYERWHDAYVNGYAKKSKWDSHPKKSVKCTYEIFLKVMKKQEDLAKKDDYYRYYIFEKDSQTIVGEIDFDVFLRSTHQFANFGYTIYNRYWGLGLGREASLAGLKIGFKQLKLNRLEAAINLDNKKSLRLARSIGMRREGIKKRYWFEYGKWTDHIIYVANPEDIKLKPHKPY